MPALQDRDLFGVRFSDTIARSAEISSCSAYRWTLTRMWGSGAHVCFIGLNPSTADALKDDPTVRLWTMFARDWGYAGFTAVNLYPFRSPSPAECRRWSRWEENGPDWYARDALLYANLPTIVREAKAAALTVACWGAGAWDNSLIEHVIEEIQSGEAPWPDLYCFGRTKHGHPKHPMGRGAHRVPDSAKPVLYRRNGD